MIIIKVRQLRSLTQVGLTRKEHVMATFSNLNKKTVGKACRRFQSSLEAVVGTNIDLFE